MSKAQKQRGYLNTSNTLLLKSLERLRDAKGENANYRAERTLVIEAYNYLYVTFKEKLEKTIGKTKTDQWFATQGFTRIEQGDSDANLIDLLTSFVIDDEQSN